MKIEKQKKPDNHRILILAGIAGVVLALLIVSYFQYSKYRANKAAVEKGVKYLTKLEKQDQDKIKEEIKSAQVDLDMSLVESDENVVWDALSEYVVMGDSRAVGFSYYGFMPEDHVLAKSGGKITDVEEYLGQVEKLSPDYIFTCFGLNDMGIGFWPEGKDYGVEYEKQIKSILKVSPDSTICVNSVLPPVGVGLEADPNYPRYKEYDAALKEMCEKNNWIYIDNTEMAQAHTDLYQPDGLHVQKEFYKYWAVTLLSGVSD